MDRNQHQNTSAQAAHSNGDLMRILIMTAALIAASTAAAADAPAPTYADQVARAARAHKARLAKCSDGPCRDRAHTILAKSLARLDADRAVVQADQRQRIVEGKR